ncbi:hypothetical protein HK097_004499 [Rhizophlyctis rosea]|uniref:RING-type domain-containing protein n=1 Tax=Rhizophlyctis rosea TaxID=64517 RepID=A0AAD5WZH4_9FUNG|nr:hypothetical protein HK097_004499 [Rhizophlyctis rosea]
MDDQLREYRSRHAQQLGEPIHQTSLYPNIAQQDPNALIRQMEEDEAFARRLAEEDASEAREAGKRQREEDERFARSLAQEETGAHLEDAFHSEPLQPPARPSTFNRTSPNTPDIPHSRLTTQNHNGHAAPDTPLQREPTQEELDFELARRLQMEEDISNPRGGHEGTAREGDDDALRAMPGAFPPDHASAHSDHPSSNFSTPITSVLGYLFGQGNQQARAQPQSTGRSYVFGYDSNRGFYSSSSDIGPMGPNDPTENLLSLFHALSTQGGLHPHSQTTDPFGLPTDPTQFTRFRTNLRPMFFTQFGDELGGQLYNEVPANYEDLMALAERLGPARAKGATDEQIGRVPVVKYRKGLAGEGKEEGKEESCPICLADFEDGEDMLVMPCAHRWVEMV